jgi:hypothetical protein
MKEFLLAGGWGTWLVLALGLAAIYTAARFAWKADVKRLAIIRALTAAIIFAVIASSCSGFIKVCHYLVNHPDLDAGEALNTLLEGLAEVTTLPALGFMALTLAWMFVAVGTRRLQDRDV